VFGAATTATAAATTTTTTTRHELGLKRPVSTSPNSLFKGLPSRLRPFVYNSTLFYNIFVVLAVNM
jgi:hypothetical protein